MIKHTLTPNADLVMEGMAEMKERMKRGMEAGGYDGCKARMSYRMIEAMTLAVGEEGDNNSQFDWIMNGTAHALANALVNACINANGGKIDDAHIEGHKQNVLTMLKAVAHICGEWVEDHESIDEAVRVQRAHTKGGMA